MDKHRANFYAKDLLLNAFGVHGLLSSYKKGLFRNSLCEDFNDLTSPTSNHVLDTKRVAQLYVIYTRDWGAEVETMSKRISVPHTTQRTSIVSDFHLELGMNSCVQTSISKPIFIHGMDGY